MQKLSSTQRHEFLFFHSQIQAHAMITMKVIVSYNTNSRLGIVWLPVSIFPNYANNMLYKMPCLQYRSATTAVNKHTQNFVLHLLWTDRKQQPHINRIKSNAVSSNICGWQWRTQEFFSEGGGWLNKFSWGQRTERAGIWGRSPLVRGSGGSCNLAQEISIHTV